MKKEYISPEFNAVRFNAEDIICTSTEPAPAQLKTLDGTDGLSVAKIADKTINVFGDTIE